MKKLDKSRDYSDVFPPENGAHYMQGSFYYDQNGDIVKHPALFDEAAEKKLKRIEALDLANAAAREARRKALAEAGEDPDTVPEEDDADESEDETKIDLKAWIRGEKIIFPTVQKAIQDQHGYNAISKRQAVEFLVGELGLVDPTEVRV